MNAYIPESSLDILPPAGSLYRTRARNSHEWCWTQHSTEKKTKKSHQNPKKPSQSIKLLLWSLEPWSHCLYAQAPMGECYALRLILLQTKVNLLPVQTSNNLKPKSQSCWKSGGGLGKERRFGKEKNPNTTHFHKLPSAPADGFWLL